MGVFSDPATVSGLATAVATVAAAAFGVVARRSSNRQATDEKSEGVSLTKQLMDEQRHDYRERIHELETECEELRASRESVRAERDTLQHELNFAQSQLKRMGGL